MTRADPPQRPRVLERCGAFPGGELTYPFGEDTAVFKVGGKIFALVSLSAERPGSVSVKCEPDIGTLRRAGSPAITPGYHLNKRHWITVALDAGVAFKEIEEMLEDSYDLVVESLPKRRREALLHGPV